MKTCQYDNNLEKSLLWSQVWMYMGRPLSPESTQTQEFIGKSQQKNESLPLVGTLPPSLCQPMPFPSLWLWTGNSFLISQCDLNSESLQCDAKNLSKRKKKKISFFTIICEDSKYEWGLKKRKEGLALGFYGQKILVSLPSDTARLSVLKV